MQVREAKDFLVQETVKQASIEGVPLSDLEKRMMYFTENEEMSEDPIALNDEFEAKYDSDEYEARISLLLHHAYARVLNENPEGGKLWRAALKELSRGDHYLPVLWNETTFWHRMPSEPRPPHDFLKLLGAGLLVAALLVSVIFAINLIADHYGIHWGDGRTGDTPRAQTRMPVWLQRLLIFIFVASYIYFAVLPWIMKKPPPLGGGLWWKLFRIGAKENRQR
jgi:hypothetical protein